MKKTPTRLQFNHLGIDYTGWATPSDDRHEDGHPKSYSVVLNGVFFGNLSCDRGKWVADEPRQHELLVAVGESLSEKILGGQRMMA